jgi:hypothetical protein
VPDRLQRALLDRIGNAEQAGGLPVDRHEHDGLAVAAHLVGLPREIAEADTQILHQGLVAERHCPCLDRPFHSFTGD